MLDPKNIRGVNEVTALGIASLWNDAIPDALHVLEHQIADLDESIDHAHTCDRPDCVRLDTRHDDGNEECGCFGCTNSGLLVMARDTHYWLTRVHDGTGDAHEFEPNNMFGRVKDYLYVHQEMSDQQRSDPTGQDDWYRPWLLGPLYRLTAELADQTKVVYAAYM